MIGAELLIAFVRRRIRSDAFQQRFHRRPRQLAAEIRPAGSIIEVTQAGERGPRGCEPHQREREEVALRWKCLVARDELFIQIELPVQSGRRGGAPQFLLGLGQGVLAPAADGVDRVAIGFQLRLGTHERSEAFGRHAQNLVLNERGFRVDFAFQRLSIVAALFVARVDGVAEIQNHGMPRQADLHGVIELENAQEMGCIARHRAAHCLQRLEVPLESRAIGFLRVGRSEDAREVDVIARRAVRKRIESLQQQPCQQRNRQHHERTYAGLLQSLAEEIAATCVFP